MSAPRRRLAAGIAGVTAVAALVAAAAGCGTSGSSASSSSGSGGGSSGAGSTVVLVTYDGYALPDAAKAWERRTGITIKLRAAGDAGAALSKAILTAGRPEGDVFFGIDNTLLTRALGARLLTRYAPAGASLVPAEYRLDPSGTLTPVDTADVCINADTQWFAGKGLAPPTDLASLADPRYKDLLVVENPATSSPGLAFVVATHEAFGSGTDDYWRRLKANGVKVSDGWTDAYDTQYTVSGGDRPLVVSYGSSPPAEVVYSNGKLTTPRSTVLQSTCFRQTEFEGLLAGAPHAAAGRMLMDEMLSAEWQAGLPLSNYVFPLRPGVTLPAVFAASAVRAPHAESATPAEIGAHRDAWIAAWRSVME